jgi:hypothetical protein
MVRSTIQDIFTAPNNLTAAGNRWSHKLVTNVQLDAAFNTLYDLSSTRYTKLEPYCNQNNPTAIKLFPNIWPTRIYPRKEHIKVFAQPLHTLYAIYDLHFSVRLYW